MFFSKFIPPYFFSLFNNCMQLITTNPRLINSFICLHKHLNQIHHNNPQTKPPSIPKTTSGRSNFGDCNKPNPHTDSHCATAHNASDCGGETLSPSRRVNYTNRRARLLSCSRCAPQESEYIRKYLHRLEFPRELD